MCGRFLLTTPVDSIRDHFGIGAAAQLVDGVPRFNIAPGQGVLAVRTREGSLERGAARRELASLRWGLIPAWAHEPDIGTSTINCGIEAVESEPAFKGAFLSRRCLIPADGFYEWKDLGEGNRRPMLVRVLSGMASERRAFAEPPHPIMFAMAGLWERWVSPDRSPIDTVIVLTTRANAFMSEIHHRMPVIIQPGDYAEWLGEEWSGDDGVAPGPERVRRLKELGHSFDAQRFSGHAVGRWVNSPRLDDARCVEPVAIE